MKIKKTNIVSRYAFLFYVRKGRGEKAKKGNPRNQMFGAVHGINLVCFLRVECRRFGGILNKWYDKANCKQI